MLLKKLANTILLKLGTHEQAFKFFCCTPLRAFKIKHFALAINCLLDPYPESLSKLLECFNYIDVDNKQTIDFRKFSTFLTEYSHQESDYMPSLAAPSVAASPGPKSVLSQDSTMTVRVDPKTGERKKVPRKPKQTRIL